ncbi:hypothetical protein ACK30D_02530 [Aeromonas caviae]|uniref:hypothetical protein n=1 Tax=Aeromonas enteropelogenes TaxID=29489 RepID=UPI001C55C120|nr:hypothetical protein KXJ75_20825 [Aeromonas sanarellii]
MTTNKKVVRQLQLAKELNFVSKERKFIRNTRQPLYEISCIQQTYATNRWLDRLLGCKGVAIAPSTGELIGL